MATQERRRLCSLADAVGKAEACPEEGCPFWEPGGAVLPPHCAFERLGLSADAELARWLLEVREELADAGSADEERALRGVFHHLLNESDE